MSSPYHPKETESFWQQYWEEHQTFRVDDDRSRKKFYCLEMFPYPSGRIHMGHVRVYTIGDMIARFKTMRGYQVLHPMGWDAFGLPAENAAIQKGIHPVQWTTQNIASMRNQLKRMGFSYDWSREVTTCSPDYYKWNQWFFLKMWGCGLAYRKEASVNWCPACATVLANEQVVEGVCWRCDSPVTQKSLKQWFFKITHYAEELLSGCDRLPHWPSRVLTMQRNWIGKSCGVEIMFPLPESSSALTIFTTRPDTLFGVTFILMAPEHPMVSALIVEKPEEAAARLFIEQVKRQDKTVRTSLTQEKEGVFTGAYARHPFTQEPIPIWIGNFVLMEYGTGSVMAVPAHDQRDFEFAKKYGLPIRLVIQNRSGTLTEPLAEAYTHEEGVLIQSGSFNGMTPLAAQVAIARQLATEGFGKEKSHYRLRDWGVSRQRYWGTPIPIVYCDLCGTVPVAESDLPVILPEEVAFTGAGHSPLLNAASFLNVLCPRCGKAAQRETDTMDTFVDSSWYFLRYVSPHEKSGPIHPDAVASFLPVDQYVGGIEHAVLHLLYARFFTKVVRDLGLIKIDEPFTRLLTQGMVIKGGAKMSKSKGNVVDPDDLIEKYGADTARLFTLFAAPPEKDLEWSDEGVQGAYRFLQRVDRLMQDHPQTEDKRSTDSMKRHHSDRVKQFIRMTHRTIKKVTDDIEVAFQPNTAIAALMTFYNFIVRDVVIPIRDKEEGEVYSVAFHAGLDDFVILLAPFAPHLAERLWAMRGYPPSIHHTPWPVYDPEWISDDVVTIVVQVNGKVRGRFTAPADSDDITLRERALADPQTIPWLKGQPVQNVIIVKGKLVNIVCD